MKPIIKLKRISELRTLAARRRIADMHIGDTVDKAIGFSCYPEGKGKAADLIRQIPGQPDRIISLCPGSL
jgi:hypothetical protein